MHGKSTIILRGPGCAPVSAAPVAPDIRWGETPSPFGHCRIADCADGICHVSFADEPAADDALAELRRAWPAARVTTDHHHARLLAAEMFQPRQCTRPLLVTGTLFQISVWQALLDVTAGKTLGYAALAARLGNPRAARATGTAVGANPIAWLIPCHRILPAVGGIGGYRWGSSRKADMLKWEQLHFC